MDLNPNHSNIEFDQGLVDNDVQSTLDISNDAFHTAGLDAPAAEWNFLAGFSVEDSDSEDYGDALAIEHYELSYSEVLP